MTRNKQPWKNPVIYAVYKGDKFIAEGTKRELVELLGISKKTFDFMHTNAYRKRIESVKRPRNPRIVVKVNREERIMDGIKLWDDKLQEKK